MSNPNALTKPRAAAIPPGWRTDPSTGFVRWWNGYAWGVYQQTDVPPAGNPYATAALVLGSCGFALTAIPLSIGWFAGGIPDLLAVIFGALGITRGRRLGGTRVRVAAIGLALGVLGIASVLFGAGSRW